MVVVMVCDGGDCDGLVMVVIVVVIVVVVMMV